MRIFDFVDDADIVELDVEELVHALEGAADGYVVLELDRDLVVNQRLEETICDFYFSEQEADESHASCDSDDGQ